MNKKNDSRLSLVHDWLVQVLRDEDFTLAPASADASFRRYFRVSSHGQHYIVMDAPPEQEDCRPFIAVSALFSSLGLNVPQLRAQDLERGLLLLDDLGERLYLNELTNETADALYADAMQALLSLQSASAEVVQTAALPDYDRSLLLSEMNLFRDWYLQRHLGLSLSAAEQGYLDSVFAFLADVALAQPQVIVHRDYHSRNLMLAEPNPGVLDFQDAVIGALTYDLVSLLRDCYIVWPLERVHGWVEQYFNQAQAAGILPDSVNLNTFIRWFDLIGIQRHLKASGIFARLNYRDQKPAYLDDIPRTLDYIRRVGVNYPELNDLLQLLDRLDSRAAAG
ncbi:Phosphotransferase involved in threonylcarbamoyladenosine t(6)A37 formation in tRNA [hydrothermal vent metagenome]|uniref:Phosphotransferase involved in threonylcarbamoyladenosine t(6)A37 formation in tRNA n=1 Tax=hydrothermal vent metagenome TaxID=652676 RepID=A0A3B1B7L7_9ZZZZ